MSDEWEKQDRECPPCKDCGTEMYEKFWGNGGWAQTEKATKQTHGKETCVAVLKSKLKALVAEVSPPCCAPAEESGPPSALAEGDDPICGRPAIYGILSAWTCAKHRRPGDRNEVGGDALRAAVKACDVGE